MKKLQKIKNYKTEPGVPLPFGTTITPDGVNFSIFSRHAEQVSLLLFEPGKGPKSAEIKLNPEVNRTGDVWHIQVSDMDTRLRYGYRMLGPCGPEGNGHFFQNDEILLDPYAKALTGGTHWGDWYTRSGRKTAESRFLRRCCIVDQHFDWEGDRPLNIPLKESIIYELHVRGFTCHSSSQVDQPGTYEGIVSKIPYLKKLGVTAVELMPVTEFYENENTCHDPITGTRLKNFWGYSPLAFFAPKASYAVNGVNGNQVKEFKEMVKALHKAGIEVILDIVFNHTAEGGMDGPTYSFRGIDNTIYYLLGQEEKDYLNFSGCGNTLNCNHPLVRNMIIDCLHYWVTEMHVDGFRFDLASILGRDSKGEVLENPPVVELIAEDPVLASTKIIAEAWDAAGLYQVGSFSEHARWAEWNGRFRDDIRSFMCGHEGIVPALATRIAGSADLYQKGDLCPYNSINFVTSHDGFTLYDLVSYNEKHNFRNGEENRDGDNHNISWNSGVEGDTSDSDVMRLRFRRMKTMAVLLFLSQGTPMLVAGDEFGRSQRGNNNAYCQDNEISWVDWGLAKQNSDLLRFFRLLIRLRKENVLFRREDFFSEPDGEGTGEILWQSHQPGTQDWSDGCKSLAFLLNGGGRGEGRKKQDYFVVFNSNDCPETFTLPQPEKGHRWFRVIDTNQESPDDILEESEQITFRASELSVAPMAAVVLVSKREKI